MTSADDRQPVDVRVSVTDRCRLRCIYCMPPEGIVLRPHEDILSFEEIVRFLRALESRYTVRKVHLTGGEPLLRRGIVDLVSMVAREGVPDLAMTTNGLGLADLAQRLKAAGLGRVNVSLDSLNRRTFAALTRVDCLDEVLAGIQAARRAGLNPVKLNMVVLRGYNDGELGDLARWAFEHSCCIRFLELMPIGCAAPMHDDLFVSEAEVRARLEESFRLAPMPDAPGQSARRYQASDGEGRKGVLGFIAPETRPFCAECRRLRLTSTGDLIGCLAEGRGPNIRPFLRDEQPEAEAALLDVVRRQLSRKRGRAGFTTQQAMGRVGG